jgi:DNA-3-methyladenine glycosylase
MILKMKKLPASFYRRDDVVTVAKELLGKVLYTSFEKQVTAGMIIETEAYNGVHDKACHAYGGRRTARTEVMYSPGGVTYVYLCYGMHQLLNVVTGPQDIPSAVLIRALMPLEGIEIMQARRNKRQLLAAGPGTVSQALGISKKHNGYSLRSHEIWIEDQRQEVGLIQAGPRVGVDYAQEDALLPYRFWYTV